MGVAAGAIVRLEGIAFHPVSPDDDEGIEIEGRAFLIADAVKPVGIERILNTVLVLAVSGEGKNIGRGFQKETGGSVEDVLSKIEDESRKDEGEAVFLGGGPDHIGEPLVVK
jgi:hypothetical protein